MLSLSEVPSGFSTSIAFKFGSCSIIPCRADGGVDSAFSLEPKEMAALVVETERAWRALGKVRYGPTEAEKKSLVFRRSIYVSKDISAGELFDETNIRIVRPGDGAPPSLYPEIIGKTARRNYSAGTPLSWDQLLQ